MIVPLLSISPPFYFIDGTKVKYIATTAKNRNRDLLNRKKQFL